jgi:hypothetical protein
MHILRPIAITRDKPRVQEGGAMFSTPSRCSRIGRDQCPATRLGAWRGGQGARPAGGVKRAEKRPVFPQGVY